MWASLNGHTDVVSLLLARGADINQRNMVTPIVTFALLDVMCVTAL